MSNNALNTARLGRMHDVLAEHVARGEMAGAVALVARGEDVHCEAVGAADLAIGRPIQRDTIFRVASMTKPVVAVAAMMLVEETRLRLGDPVDKWLPELANRQVLRTIESAVTDTVPANRPITVRDLLTFRLGIGAVMAPPGTYPIQTAINEAGVAPGPNPLSCSPGAFMKHLGSLPLLHQPGEQWMYHTGADVLGVLIARVTGQSLSEFFQERVFGPLGMKDTAFWVPEDKMDRLATAYRRGEDGALAVYDEARGGMWSAPPAFESGGGGLVSTADDFLTFGRMMLNKGRLGNAHILARPTVELMTTDQITPEQKAASPFFPGFWEVTGWGLGLSVVTGRKALGPSVGSYGWDGGFGTTWRCDPAEDKITIFLMQRMMGAPDDFDINLDFLTLAYASIDD